MVRSLEGAPDPTGLRGHFLLGEFKLDDGRTAVLIHNQDPERTQWATITFAPELNMPKDAWGVLEVDPIHATLAPLMDDSPLYPGLQIGFKPGMARFLVATPRYAAAKTDDDRHLAAPTGRKPIESGSVLMDQGLQFERTCGAEESEVMRTNPAM